MAFPLILKTDGSSGYFKLRLLLKLGRKDEAYNIVYDLLKKNIDNRDVQDLRQDKDYKEWFKNEKADELVMIDKDQEFLDLERSGATPFIISKLRPMHSPANYVYA